MSVKKLLVLAAATVAAVGATAVLAGGSDHMAMPSEPSFQNSIYLDGHIGGALSNWKNFNANNVMGASGNSFYAPNKNSKGGFTGGLDLGYNITQHIAVEGGWFYLPQVKGAPTALGALAKMTGTAKIDSWFAYGAAKLSVPVMENLDLFGKMGVAYRSLKYSGVSINGVTGNGHYWSPLFATGLQYNWGSWQLGGQYAYLPGNSESNSGNALFGAPNSAPEVHLLTAFLGYKFNV